MARPIKYKTDEERKKALNAAVRRYQLKRKIEKEGSKGDSYKAKHKIYKYPGITVSLETFNRFYISVICIEYIIGLEWTNNAEAMDVIGEDCDAVLKDWLDGQDTWSKTKLIKAWDRPEINTGYVGKRRYIKGQHHLRRETEPLSWYDTCEELLPLIAKMVLQIEKTCKNTGLKLYLKEKLQCYTKNGNQ